MLQKLSVINYALIDRVELDLEGGFTAITGETGSGKSILIGALGLLLGERADMKSLHIGDNKCVVEAVFDISGLGLKEFFEAHDLDPDDHTTIRREITAAGKNRTFINDTPVSLRLLQDLSSLLIDIHSQHENLLLARPEFQFSIIDAIAAHSQLIQRYKASYADWRKLRQQLEEAVELEGKYRQDEDYYRFQLDEVSRINLDDLNEKALEEELETLEHAEQIKSALAQAVSALDDDQGILPALSVVRNSLLKIASYNQKLAGFSERLDQLIPELKDLMAEMEQFNDEVIADPSRMEVITSRLDHLNMLLQKHRLSDKDALIQWKSELIGKLDMIGSMGDRIAELEKSVAAAEADLLKTAQDISKGRKKAAEKLSREVLNYFSRLGLPHAELSCELSSSGQFGPNGTDKIQFLFRANRGGVLHPIGQVASGGEISRVMLAVKAVVSLYQKMPVLILDEIDQGISGEMAHRVGELLREMSAQMQLFSITHLPQIAGKASHHLKVSKEVKGNKTLTHVHVLSEEQRVVELAEMLGGKSFTPANRQSALELLTGTKTEA
ncbi:MAG: repair protein RecN [Bacteroidota bacterium]